MSRYQHNLEEIKSLISTQLTLDEIFDILGWDIYDFLSEIEEHIEENIQEFEDAVN